MDNIEINFMKFLYNLKEEKTKEYTEGKVDDNIIYIFNNNDEYKEYFIKNGMNEINHDILEKCKFKQLKNGKIICLKGLCDHFIKENTKIKKKILKWEGNL